ncbi:pyridoxal phosphate-dependent decarboxylase family protein [Corynebacterium sp.]|uniref:pyridoxal phosphate-dependent decarboxylase family protein n=1 Tax=Corynebacterium sp. TaxID=1720 RepID=UPI002A90A882|nr:pyridoxal-dependent decarboxylase [Corynebacterium sp.]MDY5786466.1 pyridoxal-dependent decarboxylase [Corynebacterium sp.]
MPSRLSSSSVTHSGDGPAPNDLSDHLVGRGTSATQLNSALTHAAGIAAAAIDAAGSPARPAAAPTPGDLLETIDLDSPLSRLEDALIELHDIWLNNAVYYHHPRYLSHLNCPVATPAVAAEVLATTLNTAVESWDQAGPAAGIEQYLIRWISTALGLPSTANGVFTSGGTQSNLQALTIARNKALRRASVDRLAIFTSPAAHYSISRAADLIGIPADNLIYSSGADRDTLDPTVLRADIARARMSGLEPAAVVATAGTTDRGLIDPIAEIAEVCRAENVHLHVDAAYGAVACLSRRHSTRLRGISEADSVTVDFHKTFYQPVACSAVLLKTCRDLAHIRTHAEYLNPANTPHLNLADYSLQTTRRFDALKLWVTLRTVGPSAIGDAFDRTLEIARDVASAIEHDPRLSPLELFETPHLGTVLFSLRSDPSGELTEALRDALYDSGTAAIAVTRVHGQRLMKLTILDPSLSLNDIVGVLLAVVAAACDLAAQTTPTTENMKAKEPRHRE